LEQNFYPWASSIYYDDSLIDFISTYELLESSWNSDVLKFPYYLEKKIIKAVREELSEVSSVVIEVQDDDIALIKINLISSSNNIEELKARFVEILKPFFKKELTSLIPIMTWPSP